MAMSYSMQSFNKYKTAMGRFTGKWILMLVRGRLREALKLYSLGVPCETTKKKNLLFDTSVMILLLGATSGLLVS